MGVAMSLVEVVCDKSLFFVGLCWVDGFWYYVKKISKDASALLRSLTSAHLFSLEIFVEQIEGFLVTSCTASNGEHALASLVVRGLGNRNSSAGAAPDFADLATGTANDAANHVGGNADVLGLEFLSVFGVRWWRARGGLRRRPARVIGFGKVSATTGPVERTTSSESTAVTERRCASLRPHDRVVEYSAVPSLLVVDKAATNLPDGLLYAVRRACHFNDAFGRLGQHFLLCNHANS